MSKIHILHSWGGSEMEGFYSKVCTDNNLNFHSYRSAMNLRGTDKYDAVCRELLEKSGENIKKTYNYSMR